MVYASHFPLGVFCSFFCLTTGLVAIIVKKNRCISVLAQIVMLHVFVLLFLSWWLISCLISYPYGGDIVASNILGHTITASNFVKKLLSGDVFDHERGFCWMSLLVLTGLSCTVIRLILFILARKNFIRHQIQFSVWALFICLANYTLMLGSWALDLNVVKELYGIHYCGILLASVALAACLGGILQVLKRWRRAQNLFLYGFSLVLTLAFLWGNLSHIGERFSHIEVVPLFAKSLAKMRDLPPGRLLTHSKLGSDRPWDVAFLPLLTQKPGALSYSRGYHDSLSDYYLEAIDFERVRPEVLSSLLRLYNVRYVAMSPLYADQTVIGGCNLQHLFTLDDLEMYMVKAEDRYYGYFDFVRTPGYIEGNQRSLRLPLLRSLDLFGSNALLQINPRSSNPILHEHLVNVQVVNTPTRAFQEASYQRSLVVWKYLGTTVDSQTVVSELAESYARKFVRSQVIEEKQMHPNEYHAIIHVRDDNPHEPTQQERLLLKVSYHPFWRCLYFRVTDDYSLDRYNAGSLRRSRRSSVVQHVSPNLMAVSLPTGRYHVIFVYKVPGLLKILACICITVFMVALLGLQRCSRKTYDFLVGGWLIACDHTLSSVLHVFDCLGYVAEYLLCGILFWSSRVLCLLRRVRSLLWEWNKYMTAIIRACPGEKRNFGSLLHNIDLRRRLCVALRWIFRSLKMLKGAEGYQEVSVGKFEQRMLNAIEVVQSSCGRSATSCLNASILSELSLSRDSLDGYCSDSLDFFTDSDSLNTTEHSSGGDGCISNEERLRNRSHSIGGGKWLSNRSWGKPSSSARSLKSPSSWKSNWRSARCKTQSPASRNSPDDVLLSTHDLHGGSGEIFIPREVRSSTPDPTDASKEDAGSSCESKPDISALSYTPEAAALEKSEEQAMVMSSSWNADPCLGSQKKSDFVDLPELPVVDAAGTSFFLSPAETHGVEKVAPAGSDDPQNLVIEGEQSSATYSITPAYTVASSTRTENFLNFSEDEGTSPSSASVTTHSYFDAITNERRRSCLPNARNLAAGRRANVVSKVKVGKSLDSTGSLEDKDGTDRKLKAIDIAKMIVGDVAHTNDDVESNAVVSVRETIPSNASLANGEERDLDPADGTLRIATIAHRLGIPSARVRRPVKPDITLSKGLEKDLMAFLQEPTQGVPHGEWVSRSTGNNPAQAVHSVESHAPREPLHRDPMMVRGNGPGRGRIRWVNVRRLVLSKSREELFGKILSSRINNMEGK